MLVEVWSCHWRMSMLIFVHIFSYSSKVEVEFAFCIDIFVKGLLRAGREGEGLQSPLRGDTHLSPAIRGNLTLSAPYSLRAINAGKYMPWSRRSRGQQTNLCIHRKYGFHDPSLTKWTIIIPKETLNLCTWAYISIFSLTWEGKDLDTHNTNHKAMEFHTSHELTLSSLQTPPNKVSFRREQALTHHKITNAYGHT